MGIFFKMEYCTLFFFPSGDTDVLNTCISLVFAFLTFLIFLGAISDCFESSSVKHSSINMGAFNRLMNELFMARV